MDRRCRIGGGKVVRVGERWGREIGRRKIIHSDANAARLAACGDTPVILALGRVGQEDGELEASLSNIVIQQKAFCRARTEGL